MILTYFGRQDKVYLLLQVISHKGRAFCLQQGGLKGFLLRNSLSKKQKETQGSFHTIVPIKDGIKHCSPFDIKLPSKLITALLLSYVGTKAEVC